MMDDMIAMCMSMMNGMMGGMMSGGMMSPMWFLPWIVGIGLIAVAVFAVIRTSRHSQAVSPLTILQRRYAQGQITSEQFEVMREQISSEYPTQQR